MMKQLSYSHYITDPQLTEDRYVQETFFNNVPLELKNMFTNKTTDFAVSGEQHVITDTHYTKTVTHFVPNQLHLF